MSRPRGSRAQDRQRIVDGTLDDSFGSGGVATASTLPTGGDDRVREIIEVDGRLLTAGHCDVGAGTALDVCTLRFDRAGSFDQYQAPANGWSSVGTSHFAACLTGVTGGSAVWDADPACAMSDGTHWNALPAAPAHVASANPLQPAATASFRFGLRTAPDQPAGTYVAPIAFEVVAP